MRRKLAWVACFLLFWAYAISRASETLRAYNLNAVFAGAFVFIALYLYRTRAERRGRPPDGGNAEAGVERSGAGEAGVRTPSTSERQPPIISIRWVAGELLMGLAILLALGVVWGVLSGHYWQELLRVPNGPHWAAALLGRLVGMGVGVGLTVALFRLGRKLVYAPKRPRITRPRPANEESPKRSFRVPGAAGLVWQLSLATLTGFALYFSLVWNSFVDVDDDLTVFVSCVFGFPALVFVTIRRRSELARVRGWLKTIAGPAKFKGLASWVNTFRGCLKTIVGRAKFKGPTLYRYDHLSTSSSRVPIRISRVTGRAEMLTEVGWVPMGLPRGDALLPEPQRQQVSVLFLRVERDHSNFVVGEILNRSDYVVTRVVIRLNVIGGMRGTQQHASRRVRADNLHIHPGFSGYIREIVLGANWPRSAEHTVTLDAVYGYPQR